MIGTRLLHYEVLEKLGEGGMGVVYKARDTHLDRFVAIKVLPEGSVADPQRRQRFVQEARAASSLNHPGIIHVYDIGSDGGLDFIAMEYVQGTDLAQCIGRNGIELAEALKYAIQVADALAAAHAAGIVHRDLKPANIMVAEKGLIKVLDFGLAKLIEPRESGSGQSTTRTMGPLTAEGVVVGTAAYMSPEQAEGKPIDARSDIFSFGSVLYEMVTGRRAFPGESNLSVLSAILDKEPMPLRELAPGAPDELAKIINRCLRKDPDYRFQHMDDVKVLLREIKEESGPRRAATGDRLATSGVRAKLLLAAMAVALFLGAVAAGIYYSGRQPMVGELLLRKFQITIGGDISRAGFSDSPTGPTIAPDGKKLAYTSGDRLWVRDLSQTEAREIPDTQGALGPFWSPDSEFVVYAAQGVLKRASAQGGPSTTLCELARQGNFLGGTWGTAGSIAFGISSVGLFEIPAQGGEPKPLLKADPSKGEADFHSPYYLPDGHTILFTVHPTSGYQYRLALLSGQGVRRLLDDAAGNVCNAVYSASGYLIYGRIRGTKAIYAIPFSLSSLSASGEPFLVAQGAARASVSKDGTLLYESARPEQLVLVDRTGRLERVVADSYEQIRFPAFSPDGQRLAFMGVQDGNHDIWIHDLTRGSKARLTADPQTDQEPAWSPSGEDIAYVSRATGRFAIVGKHSDGSGEVRPLVSAPTGARSPEWSPGGKDLVYLATGPKGGTDIWRAFPGAPEGPRPFVETPFTESNPRISPDGRYIACTSDESGRNEVYVRSYPQGQGIWPVSVNGGSLPRWSRRGDELFYVEGNSLMVVAVETKAAFRPGVPKRLFSGDEMGVSLYSFSPLISDYDVSPDGRHLAAVRLMGGAADYLTVVENWLTEFQSRK